MHFSIGEIVLKLVKRMLILTFLPYKLSEYLKMSARLSKWFIKFHHDWRFLIEKYNIAFEIIFVLICSVK